jgi:Universal stress protein family
MADVLAAIVGSESEPLVTGVATAVAEVVHAHVRRVRLARGTGGELDAAQFLREMAAADTVLGVLARDAPSPKLWPRVVQHATKPLIVVPPVPLPQQVLSRVLVPLDGTAEAAGAVAETVELFARAGVDVVVLHVFDGSTVPRFWDQAAHARREWETEFLARFCDQPGVRLELRSGMAGDHVVDVSATEKVDLITLGWSRRLDPGRAGTVRRTVAAAAVPVMLVPLVST